MTKDSREEIPRRFLTDHTEIEAFDGFTDQFSEEQVGTLMPLMPYRLLELVPCGISSCRTGHKRGYVVQVNDQTISLIGNCCGTKIFGKGFDVLARELERELDRKHYLHRATMLQKSARGKLQVLREQCSGKGHAVHSQLQSFARINPQLWDALRRRAFRNDTTVTKLVERPKGEKEVMEMLNEEGASPQYSQHEIKYKEVGAGNIAGLSLVLSRQQEDSWETLKDLAGIETVDLSACPMARLKKFVNAGERLDSLIDGHKVYIRLYETFYTPENFQLLENMQEVDADSRARLYACGWDFETHTIKRHYSHPKAQKKYRRWMRRQQTADSEAA